MLKYIVEFLSDTKLMAGLTGLLTVVTGFAIARHGSKDKSSVDERTQLSLDEGEFRKSIIEQLKQCKEDHELATSERTELSLKNIALERRISELESNCYSCLYRASGNNPLNEKVLSS